MYKSGLSVNDLTKITGRSYSFIRKTCDINYKSLYQSYKEKGICWKCKQKDAIKGRSLCEECLAEERERWANINLHKSVWELELEKIQYSLNEIIRLLKTIPMEQEEKLIYSKLITYYKNKVMALKKHIREVNKKWH